MNDCRTDSDCNYWDKIAEEYHKVTRISTEDFHYGPLIPGDKSLNLLPVDLKGKRCLELGCGAAQNSIYLAKQNAECIAVDVSTRQIKHAQVLAEKEHVDIQLVHASVETLPRGNFGAFDLIHSSYSLPFWRDPGKVIKKYSEWLIDGGMFLLSTGHPLACGEWFEVDNGEKGLFYKDYFSPLPDIRFDEHGRKQIQANFYPVGVVVNWMIDAGLKISQLLEPEPLVLEELVMDNDVVSTIPYVSNDWLDQYEKLSRIPVVIIICAVLKK